jgi:outer membrane receptor protein involved in Fe transport
LVIFADFRRIMRPAPVKTRRLVAFGIGLFVALLATSPAGAQTGNISGKVIDGKTKDALPFANVVILGTPYGAMSMEDGSFFIRGIPEGAYSVRASFMGYEPGERDSVLVEAYSTTEADFGLLKTVLMTTDEVVVTAERPMVEVDVPSTVRSVTEEELTSMPVTDVEDVVGLQAGVIESDDEIHIRGGRSDETLYIIDGVKMKDLISGKSSLLDISARSVAEMDVITGGYSAEYGQALSGIVNIKLKEGGSRTKGYIEYSLDHMPFRKTKLDYFDTDRFELGLEGPEPISSNLLRRIGLNLPGQVTYFVGVSARFSDTHLPSISEIPGSDGLKSSYEESFLGMTLDYEGMAPRAENKWQLFGKTVWRPSSNNKFGISFTKTIAIDQGYYRYDPYDVTRQLSGYQHEWSRYLDSALVYTEDTNSLVFSWNQILSQNSFHILKLSRFFNCLHGDVAGKHWHDYTEPDDRGILGEDNDTPYFIETGNADLWHDRFIETYNISWDLTARLPPHHQIKTGINSSYENAQYIFIRRPWIQDPDSLGEFHDIFHIYPNRGAFYVQDKINFEGLIGDIGLRYDYWFPGKQVERAIADTMRFSITQTTRDNFYRDTRELFGHRFKGHLSPRIAISHPITDRDNLFFNYGHFSQIPSYIWIYSKLSSVSSERFPLIGNPNLNPEISVQYEIGARHQFTETVAGNLTLFYKDIYDYPTSTKFEKPGVGEMFIYRNLDYARSRGIEIELKKKRRGLVGGSVVYTYSIATGKSSDPNTLKLIQEQGGDVGAREGSLAEEYLWWNRPHKINAMLDLKMASGEHRKLFGFDLPSDWTLNIQWMIQSGKAYTPAMDGQEIGKRYSENGPADNVLDLRFTKYFVSGSTKAKIYLQVKNVFNDKRVRRIDPETGEAPRVGVGSHEEEAGSIYAIHQYGDPSIYGPPRRATLGMGIEW